MADCHIRTGKKLLEQITKQIHPTISTAAFTIATVAFITLKKTNSD
jgi:hypothetical protein